jgi:hypothetical protein
LAARQRFADNPAAGFRPAATAAHPDPA